MTPALDRIEIESVGGDPVQLARALLTQLPDLDVRVPIDEIALALDIVGIEVAPLVSIEACLQCDARKDKGQIVVNADSSPQRRRYSIGHELGHFLNERHRPMTPGGFACTRQDMAAPRGSARHLQQEGEANTFAIEALAPRRLLTRHLKQAADLEHALDIAKRLDISRAAAARRYVNLHEECLAAAFSRDGQILYIEKPEDFPATALWSDDRLGPHQASPGEGSSLTGLDGVAATGWLSYPDTYRLFAQTLYQQDGYAITLLVAERDDYTAETPWEPPRFQRSRRKP